MGPHDILQCTCKLQRRYDWCTVHSTHMAMVSMDPKCPQVEVAAAQFLFVCNHDKDPLCNLARTDTEARGYIPDSVRCNHKFLGKGPRICY